MKRFVVLALGLGLWACSDSEKDGPPSKGVDAGPDACLDCEDVGLDSGPDQGVECGPTEAWQPGGAAVFRDVSEEWGLKGIQAVGSRISVVDYDSDGRPDIFVRRSGRDDFGENRRAWLLRNTGSGFEDTTQASGILAPRFTPPEGRPAEVAVFGDMDNDGDLDAVTGFTNDGTEFEGIEIMMNQGDGTFALGELYPFHQGQTPFVVGGISLADVDLDGNLDIWIGMGAPEGIPAQDQLWMRSGDTFEDRTVNWGVTTQDWTLNALNNGLAHSNAWSTAACNLGGDRRPELMAASYGRAPNHLWWSNSRVYENQSVTSGYAFDENQDWTASHSARCFCDANPEAEGCDTAPDPIYSCASYRPWDHSRDRQPFRLGGNSGTTVCADLNNDGLLDLVTTEIVHWDVGANSDPSDLLYNNGDGTFTRRGAELGLVKDHASVRWDDGDITAAVFDFDNDGRNDVLIASTDYPGTRAHLYWQRPDGTFEKLAPELGIDMKSAHGVAVADFDGDGDLDLIVGHSANRCSSGDHCYPAGERHVRIFENTVGQDRNWVKVKLEGPEGVNRSAIGAQVTVDTGDLKMVQEVGGGHGHYGLQDEMTLHFGVGDAKEVDITVDWPTPGAPNLLQHRALSSCNGERVEVIQLPELQ